VAALLGLSRDTEMEVVRPFVRRSNLNAASHLDLHNSEVMEMTFTRLYHGEVFCVTEVAVPVEVWQVVDRAGGWPQTVAGPAQRGALSRHTVIGLLERSGVHIAGAEQSIIAVSASAETAISIDCAAGDPVLRIARLYFDREGRRVEFAVTHANPVRYTYRLELRRAVT